jgi:hypothetical protein
MTTTLKRNFSWGQVLVFIMLLLIFLMVAYPFFYSTVTVSHAL